MKSAGLDMGCGLSNIQSWRRLGNRALTVAFTSLPWLWMAVGGCGSSQSSSVPNPPEAAGGNAGAGSPGDTAGAEGGLAAGAGGSQATTSVSTPEPGSGPSFKEYILYGINMATRNVYGTNGAIIGSTLFSYVENTGGSGTAPVTITYQGYTETQQFPVDAGTQYVLGSKFTITSPSPVTTCLLSSELPGLSLNQDLGSKPSAPTSVGGQCSKVSGPSTSFLIPLSSCSCSDWFAIDANFRYTNCGLADPGCCNSCPSGKICNNGMCRTN